MDEQELRDDQWDRLAPLIPGGSKGKRGAPRSQNRRFFNALLWMAPFRRAIEGFAQALWA